jgi:hypothetical protein
LQYTPPFTFDASSLFFLNNLGFDDDEQAKYAMMHRYRL